MKLSKIGEIAEKFWLQIPKHFSNVYLDEFVIMPNHIHGILIIKNKNVNNDNNNVETCHGMSLQNDKFSQKNQFNKFSKPIKNSLSMIINQYKSAVKRYTNKQKINFHWQSRFYDHIIRNEKIFK
ncbi:MAG: hypothetical protein KatS3mg092_0753 [Patescibacteria group bacterium]|nr:MAG: hypothetical protein KatS3mg092_0753 [Patescibacteria group bacterium]